MMYFPIIESLKRIHSIDTGDEYLMPIPKCAYTTQNHLAKQNDWEIKSVCDLSPNEEREFTIFIRDPLDRFWSGIDTAFHKCLTEDKAKMIADLLFVNWHVLPQFFYILKLYDHAPNSNITFHSHKDIGEILSTEAHLNFKHKAQREKYEEMIRSHRSTMDNHLENFYLPDKIIWDEFRGKRINFQELRDRIRSEKPLLDQYIVGKEF